MRNKIKDQVNEATKGLITEGSIQVFSDRKMGQRILLEFNGVKKEEQEACMEAVKQKFPNATVMSMEPLDF